MSKIGMTPSDAKEFLASKGEEWEMPEDYWQILLLDTSAFHCDEDTARRYLDHKTRVTDGSGSHWFSFKDIYGSEVYLRHSAIAGIHQLTKTSRAKWILGMKERNWKEDEKEGWEEE